ncbi:hypothetical protein GTQ34_00980 [Muricauda sp. JGD-17]|uniref:Lipocalin-like domain-containing protein n=1 Tax=Flagellimonas ochracea TaxID=2696472 RepID=A0A964T932_9FLAO|nr:hypothetical protein [Allomuricauda ochracea]NAY90478.1 hypothetical protein [Allomuricauda ochracea]
MTRIFLFVAIVLLSGCKKNTLSGEDLHYLNGYWEIIEVEFPDGAKKEYSVNPSIDFIQLNGNEGFRKKMQPKFDGSYNTSNDAELFTVVKTEDHFALYYKNSFDDWTETLVKLDSTSFSVINEAGIQYTYRRFQPIAIPK